MNTIERARGRWRKILMQLGIEALFLVNKHGPCPLCGGKDRYRWDDKDGTGSYYCNQCGPGPGIMLIRKKYGWNHATACNEIDKIIGTDPIPAPRPKKKDSPESKQAAIDRIIAQATDTSIVEQYLRGRGLSVIPPVLLGHPSLPYFDNGRPGGHYPAMIAPVTGPDGRLQSAHRTYIGGRPGENKKPMPPVKTISGAAVRLFEPTSELGISEGIETAIAAYEHFNIPTWAAISANGMETFQPPAGLQRLRILADHDRNYRGQKAAYVLAHRLADTIPVIEVLIPPQPGTDWLDQLNLRAP